MEQGLLCGLSGTKPTFKNECPYYELDSEEKEREERKRIEDLDSTKLTGFPAFYLYFALPVGLAFTIGSFLINFNPASYAGSYLLMAVDVITLLFYIYFSIYILYAFKKMKPDAVFIAKYQLILVFVTNLIVLIATGGEADSFTNNAVRLVASLVWAVIFFIALSTSDDVNYLIPKEKRKLVGFNKYMVILSIVLPIILLVAGVFQVAAKSSNGSALVQQIKEYCEISSKALPQTISEDLTATGIYVTSKTLVFEYEYEGLISRDITDSQKQLMYLTGRERILNQLPAVCSDPIITMAANAGYDVIWRYDDSENQTIYSIPINNNELKNGLEPDYSHTTSTDTMQEIVKLFSSELPYELDEHTRVEAISLSNDGSTLKYQIKLQNTDMSSLANITSQDLKSYVLEIVPLLSDAPMTIAVMNDVPLEFDFIADCSDWWSMTINVGPEEYKK